MLFRSCNAIRRCTVHHNVYLKRYCSNLNKNNNEYEVTFYSRPFGLDLKYNEFNDEISVQRAAWKDIKINSVLYKINGEGLNECIANDIRQEEEEQDQEVEDDDHNTFKSTIKYLQKCPLPTKIIFKTNATAADNKLDPEDTESNTFSSLMAPFLELPKKSFYDMNNKEFIHYLQMNWMKQMKIYHKFHSNPVFKEKYSSFLSLIHVLQKNIKNFNKIGQNLKNVPELNGETLSNYTINKDFIYQYIKKAMSFSTDTATANNANLNIPKVKDEIIDILTILQENNFEKIECHYLFDTLFGELLFDAIINLTQRKHNINKTYLCDNKRAISGKLCHIFETKKDWLKTIASQTKIIGVMNRYFDKNYDFMTGNGDIDRQSEYWFIVTLLDLLSFPFGSNELILEEVITDKKALNNGTYKYILTVNDISFHPHNVHEIGKINVDSEMCVKYIGDTDGMYSLMDRFKHFDCNLFEIHSLQTYILKKLNIENISEIQEIEQYLQHLPLENLSTASQLEIEIETEVEDEDNMANFEIFIDDLSIWMYNIVEILRVNHNKEHELFNYLSNQRPKYLIKNELDTIKTLNNNEFVNFISNKISEIGNENEFENVLHGNKHSLFAMLANTEWNGQMFCAVTMTQILDKLTEINDGNMAESDLQQIVNWLYCEMHRIQRIDTPIFDAMMQQRNSLKNSLLDDRENVSDYKGADGEREREEFNELKQAVDDKLLSEDNPQWIQYSDDFEENFVVKFMNENGFKQHSEKFKSMSCLAKLKNRQMRKMEMCARDRKNLMKKVNKWHEIQNIIKYGNKPYYRSDGCNRSELPSFNQCYAEIGPNKDRNFDPKADQTKVTKMFYVPFVNYAELHQFVKKRKFAFKKQK